MFFTLGTFLVALNASVEANWPQFRGPSTGVAEDGILPETWSTTKNVVWSVEIPGRGWSSPIVWEDRVFVTSAISEGDTEMPKKGLYLGGNRNKPSDKTHRWMVYCIDLNSGKVLWEKLAHKAIPKHPLHIKNTHASETPVTDGERIYAYFGNVGLFCYDLDGNKLIWQNEQRTELVTSGRVKVRSYDLDGTLLWQMGGMSSIVIPTPFAKHGLLYISSGYVGDRNRPLYAIRPGAKGDITLNEDQDSNKHVLWCQKKAGPYNPSPIAYRDYLYVLYDRGFFGCYDAKSGNEVYSRQRIAAEASAFTSSPWANNGKIFCLSEDGDSFVIQAGPEFKVLGSSKLDEMCMATPAAVRGSLIIRTISRLYRIKS